MISNDEIKKLARLARIELSQNEQEDLQHDLESILAYVNHLSNAETSSVVDSLRVNSEVNVMCSDADEVKLNSEPDFLVASAPQKDGRYVKVKSVF